MDPKVPVRADYRFILRVINLSLPGKVDPHQDEFDRITRVFSQLGGSWERIFRGSSGDISKLKQVIKLAYKNGFLTKKERWV